MIEVKIEDGKIAVHCGDATGADLICEASAAIVSVVGTAVKKHKNKKTRENLAKEVFVQITGLAATIIEEEHGISVCTDDDEDDCDDDDVDEVVAKAIPIDSDTDRKLMELLGIDPDEAESGDDDETEDDIPDFLF